MVRVKFLYLSSPEVGWEQGHFYLGWLQSLCWSSSIRRKRLPISNPEMISIPLTEELVRLNLDPCKRVEITIGAARAGTGWPRKLDWMKLVCRTRCLGSWAWKEVSTKSKTVVRYERQERVLPEGEACTVSVMKNCMKIHVPKIGVGETCTGLPTASKLWVLWMWKFSVWTLWMDVFVYVCLTYRLPQ